MLRSLGGIRGKAWGALLLVGVVAMVVAAACGDDDNGGKTATATGQASTAAGGSQTAQAASYPMTITDMAKRTVEIKAKPQRIVAISPTATEMVYAAGGTVVGRSSTVDFPAAAQQAADIGSAYSPSTDKILALKPDLVVGDAVIIQGKPDITKTLDGMGVPVMYVGAESYNDVLAGLDLMGKVLDNKAATDQVKAGIVKARDDAKAALAGKNVSGIAITADEKGQIYAAKDSSYVGDILKQVGISNPANALPDSPPIPGYSLVAPEKLLELNPDYIFAITPDPHAPQLSGLILQMPAFKSMKAVANNHVEDANVELFLQAPGPRIADAFKAITAAVTGAAASNPAH